MGVEHELHLLWSLALNGALLSAAWCIASVWGGPDRLQQALDTLLLWWAGQYLIVGACGILGGLAPVPVTVLTAVIAGAGWLLAGRRTGQALAEQAPADRYWLPATVCFVIGYLAAVLWAGRDLPATADDALTYHLPAAASWLQSGRIGLLETWFFNPANTYSPLAGSIFAAWAMIPFGHDVLARYVQAPAVLAIMLATARLAIKLGAPVRDACLIGAAAVLCRPVISQVLLAKDDLFLSAFILIALCGAGGGDRLAIWRVGLAVGLAAATKYTSVYALLMLPLAMSGRPARRHGIIALIAAVVVLPWLVRNWVVTGNPLFPMTVGVGSWAALEGLFATSRSPVFGSAAEMWGRFVSGYFGVHLAVLVPVAGSFVAAWAIASKGMWRDPMRRAVLAGPPLCFAAFYLTSPYAELRFITAALVLAIGSTALLPGRTRLVAAIVIFCAGVGSSFPIDRVIGLAESFGFLWTALLVTAVAMGLRQLWQRRRAARPVMIGLGVTAVTLSVWTYWRAYVVSLPELAQAAWSRREMGGAWQYLARHLTRDEAVAYTNTYLVYPLMGSRHEHRLIPAPADASLLHLHQLPHSSARLNERNLLVWANDATRTRLDEQAWVKRLQGGGADVLVVGKRLIGTPANSPPPELAWAVDAEFELLYDDPAAAIFRIRP